MTEHTVSVYDRPHKVTVEQKSKSVWIAVGDYKGKSIEVKDRTEHTALKRWREAAHYAGN
jgi:hypothetical protein